MRSWCVACDLCQQRKARRSCPALNRTICPVCCATKRQVEITCPDDCPHLHTAREHPAAVVRRQQERDVALLLPSMQGLTERQHQLFFLFHNVIARHTPDGFARLNDDDVAEAAAALASTFETAARGVIYEQLPELPVARALAAELRSTVDDMRTRGVTVYDHELAVVLRAIERGARVTRTHAEGGAGAYLALVARLIQAPQASRPGASGGTAPGSQTSIVLP